MKIQILFNSHAVRKDLATGWGFSCLVSGQVLFDTGEKALYLSRNLEELGVDMDLLEAAVISHDHWDHTGGLEEVLKRRPGLDVYICPGFSKELKQRIVSLKGHVRENSGFCRIKDNIYVTGEMVGTYKEKNISEQAVVIDTEKGLTVITGCAHPHILDMVERVRQTFTDRQVYAVLGGFHLMDKTQRRIQAIIQHFSKLGIQKVGPTHCCGTEAEHLFREAYQENCLELKVGEEMEV